LQLLALACLSIAAKIEETNVPQSVDLQVSDALHWSFFVWCERGLKADIG